MNRMFYHSSFKIKTAILLLIFCFFSGFLYKAEAKESEWIEAVGEAVADETRPIKDIKEEALSKARSSVIEQAVGVKIQAETVLKNFRIESDFVASLSSGHIIEEKILKWETEALKKDDVSTPVMIYRVFIKAKAALEKGSPDPSFKLYASTNRSVFKNGDGVSLRIKSTKNCYITIFVITEENRAYLIFPNKYKKNSHIAAGEEFIYPSENDISKGLSLQAGLFPGHNKAKEMFRIIATKKPISLTPEMFTEGIGLTAFSKETATLRELVKELMMIPADERTDTFITYEIVK